ncbi:uncharacterized protein LOC111690406 [Lucilia cuprina]|uniref:uncharacterized protein LOC111690406 n=1 Tax=Lucilia cuprina TaxID=7375 RepID=UPI001F06B208|nr:uncharacterized protein LOC111690406 [Lucilia cuprina]XP_046806417.1 uncharacterized protein LOC111690406 [Lucilia cuprina]
MLYTRQPITLFLISFLTILATPAFLVTAYIIDTTKLTDASTAQSTSSSYLGSKVIFQSPSVENIYKEMIVSSKPLNLRKYSTRPKTKKTKKDSRIYYIPIPPLPYRFLPGIGYDYQPMKIKPLLMEPEVAVTTEDYSDYKIPNPYKHYQQQLQMSYLKPLLAMQQQKQQQQNYQIPTTVAPVRKPPVAESKVFRVDRDDYYFNGRPFRLQVAHAGPKYNLTPQNLKSSFYFDKNIIY